MTRWLAQRARQEGKPRPRSTRSGRGVAGEPTLDERARTAVAGVVQLALSVGVTGVAMRAILTEIRDGFDA